MNEQQTTSSPNALSPYLIVDDMNAYLEFLTKAFGAELIRQEEGLSGGGQHAECLVIDTVIMIGASPKATPNSIMLHLFVDDVEEAYQRALDAGAESLQAPMTPEYGGRRAAIKDPAGNTWFVARE